MKADEKILESAYRLFVAKGMGNVTLQHVARSCGISLDYLLERFKSKRELVIAVVSHMIQKKSNYLFINSSLSPSAVTELGNFFKFVADSLQDLKPLFHEARGYDPLVPDRLSDLVDGRLIPYLRKNIERGRKEGFYRDALDSDQYASTYFYVIRTVLESGHDRDETRRAIAHINDIFFHGVLNAKGMRV